MDKFTIGEVVSYGWEAFKANAVVLIGIFVIISVLNSVPSVYLQVAGPENAGSAPYFIIMAAVWLVSMLASCGTVKILLDIHDGRGGDFADFFTNVDPFLNFLLGSLLMGLIVAIGMVLLIVPGIYLGIRFSMFSFAVVDEGLGPVEALKRSWELTSGSALNLFLLGLVFFGLEIAGVIALCIGIFVAIPVISMAYVYVYRQLKGKATAAAYYY